jgi:hypothetical protein
MNIALPCNSRSAWCGRDISRVRALAHRVHRTAASAIAWTLLLCVPACSIIRESHAEKVVVVGGASANDMREKLGLIQDYNPPSAVSNNVVKLQAFLDAGWPQYPLYFPGAAAQNQSDYIFTNTIVIPSNTGWRFCGMGYGTPSGTAGDDFMTSFTMRGSSYARQFGKNGQNYLTSSQAGAFCDVPSAYYSVQPTDKYQAVEITDGTNATPGWYGIDTGPNVVSNGSFTGSASSWTLGGGALYQSNTVGVTTGAGTCSQNSSCLAGYLYTITYTVSNVTSGGSVQVSLGGTSGTQRTANGAYTEDIYCGAGTNQPLVFTFGGGGSATCTVDNVSVGSAAVDVENNRWGLDRAWCTGATTAGEGFFCPELIQCGADGTVWDGIMFKGRRVISDVNDPTVLFHQITNGQTASKIPAGKNHFTNCGFYAAKIGILCGHDLRGAYFDEYGYSEPNGGSYKGNHADHLNLDKVWFQEVDTCIYLRNEQSVSHSFRDIRVSECGDAVFRIDSGGVIEGNGFWVSGGYGEDGPTVVRLGKRANNGNIVLQSVHFDHSVYHPRLVESDPNIDLHTNVVFNGGTLSVDKPDAGNLPTDPSWTQDAWDSNYKPNWYLIDVCGDARIAVHDFCSRSHSDDIYGLWPKCIKVKNGATSAYKPHILITGTQCWVENPEDLIDLANSDAGAVVEFESNYRYGGVPLRNGRYIVGSGWDTSGSGWAATTP